MTLALVGNQNSGKTTLFNQLTGSNQHVGNFPGVTVEQKSGEVRGHNDITLVDLPGIYSLRPYSSEEMVTRDFLLHGGPNGVINIVDATNIERNLYLTLQLTELGLPMVLALNMMDEVRSNNGSIDVPRLSRELGIPVVAISASKNQGLDRLLELAVEAAGQKRRPVQKDYCAGAAHRCIHTLSQLVKNRAAAAGIPVHFAAVKLVEGDAPIIRELALEKGEREIAEEIIRDMEAELGTDRNAVMADLRYTFIEGVCRKTVVKGRENKERVRSVKIDNVLTGKYMAIPIFLASMLMIFWLTFGVIGTGLSNLLILGIDRFSNWVDSVLTGYGLNPTLQSLVIDGIFAGVGSVLSFLPIILTLFFFLSILEDSGYMARVAFVMDKLLRKIGLTGRSFVPMLIGFGCTVPAVMATRTLSSERDRRMTILLTPFMSCTAKLPIYAVFTAAFFRRRQVLVMMLLYLMGIALGILCGFILNKTTRQGKPAPFIMELPNYRLPSPKSVWLLMWEKAKDFLARAFTVIMAATIIVWFLQTFNYQFNVVDDSSKSLLGTLGMAVTPLFYPLGLRDWRISTALITGLTAKETVVSTLAVLTSSTVAELEHALPGLFTPLTAFSFLTFTLLYTPCMAAVAAISREMRSAFSAFKMVLLQCAIAWLAAMLVYQVGSLLGF